MNSLKLTNSLTRKKEIFKPINSNKVSLYACGPTVYDSPHVVYGTMGETMFNNLA